MSDPYRDACPEPDCAVCGCEAPCECAYHAAALELEDAARAGALLGACGECDGPGCDACSGVGRVVVRGARVAWAEAAE